MADSPDLIKSGGLLANQTTVDGITIYRRLSSQTVASTFQLQPRDQFGGQTYDRSNATLANLSTQLGASANASGNRSTAVGAFSYAKENSGAAFGVYALSLGPSSIAIGDQAKATAYRSIAEGAMSFAAGVDSIALGVAGITTSTATRSILIGGSGFISGQFAVGIGQAVNVSGNGAVVIGQLASSSGLNTVVVGSSAAASGTNAMAFGAGSSAPFSNSVAIGNSTVTTSSNQVMIGYGTQAGTIPLSLNITGPIPWVDVIAWGADPSGAADSSTAFNNAVASLPAVGGTVFVPDGLYKLTSAVAFGTATKPVVVHLGAVTITISASIYLHNKSGIVGIGRQSIIKQAANINLDTLIQINTNPVSATLPIGAFVKNIQLDGTVATNATTHAGIRIGNSLTADATITNTLITNNYFHHIQEESVWADHASGVLVTGNLFEDTGDQAFKAGGNLATRVIDNHFAGNIVNRYGQFIGGGGGIGVQLRNADNCVIIGNTITGVPPTVCGTPTSLEAIDILNGSGNTITGNTVYTTGAEGITLTNDANPNGRHTDANVISGNTINRAWTAGIAVTPQWDASATARLRGNTISNNTILNANDGITALGCVLAAGFDCGIRISGASVMGAIVNGNNVVDNNATRACNYAVGVDNAGALALATQIGNNWFTSLDTTGTWDVWRSTAGTTTNINQWNRAQQLVVTPGVDSTTAVLWTKTDGTTKIAAIDSTNQFLSIYGPGKLNFFGATSGNITVAVPAIAGANAWILPAATDTLVGQATTDTLSNKTLASPIITGNAKFTAAGDGLLFKRGTNATFGIVTLSAAGTALIYSTKITTSSAIFLAPMNTSGTAGSVYISTSTNLVSATVASTNVADTRDIYWFLVGAS